MTAAAFATSTRRAAIFALILSLFSLIGTVALVAYVLNHAAFGALLAAESNEVCRTIPV